MDRLGGLLSIAVLASMTLIVACGEDRSDGVSRAPGPRYATPDHAVLSPSGDYRLEVVEGEYEGAQGDGSWWRVRVRDSSSGETLFDSPKRLSARFETRVLWDDRVDRAWVYSSDVGTSYWQREGEEGWTREALGLKGIASGTPRVPEVLSEAFPETFGPEARTKAAQRLREQGPTDAEPLGSDISEDDPRILEPE